MPRVFRGFHDEEIGETRDPLFDAVTTPQLIRFHGLECEEHVVMTADGYILVLHRIIKKDDHLRQRTHTGTSSRNGLPSPTSSVTGNSRGGRIPQSGPPILVIHGAMISSEIWVCQRSTNRNLVFRLANEGYDVWLANRRGTKYSQKHVIFKPHEERFWDFSMDEMIMHDVPAQVEYILGLVGHKTITLMGFSQGTAESFGALSFSRKLNRRVNCMVGLSATCKPPLPTNGLIRSMVYWTPELVYLLLGRRSMLRSVCFWQSILSPKAMAWLMDMSMFLLFGWKNTNIRAKERPLMYRSLFSLASVKSISHWFQIMRAGRFQMYDDQPPGRTHIIPAYPLSNIRTPILAILGMKDGLVDREFIEREFGTASIQLVDGYEHMDTIWANDVDKKVFPMVIDFIKAHSPLVKNKGLLPSAEIISWPPTPMGHSSIINRF